MFPIMSPGLRQSTPPAASASSSAAGTARRQRRARRGVFAAPPLIAVLLLVLCSCGTAQASPRGNRVGSMEQLTGIRPTSRVPQLTETFLSPIMVEVSARWKLLGGNGFAHATCPTGDFALGGGWVVPDTEATVYSAVASGATWTIGVHRIGYPIGVYATVYAECLAGTLSAFLTQQGSSMEVPADSGASGLEGCIGDSTLVGGGFNLTQPNGSIEVTFSEPLSIPGFVPPDWYVGVQNHTSTVEQFSYYAECLSDVVARTYPLAGSEPVNLDATYPVSGEPLVASGQTATVSVDCPAEYELAGGGFAYIYYPNNSEQVQNGVGNLYLQHTIATGWEGTLYNEPAYGPATFQVYVTAVCLDFV